MKIVRRIGYFILTVILLLLAGYVFFIYNAESLIKEFVFKESKGKMRLEIGKLHFYPMEARLTIIRPHFLFTDSIHQPSTFDIKADKITLELASLKDLLFRKQIEVDSITFLRPHIKVTQWQEIKSEKFSLPEQMEKAYNFLNI